MVRLKKNYKEVVMNEGMVLRNEERRKFWKERDRVQRQALQILYYLYMNDGVITIYISVFNCQDTLHNTVPIGMLTFGHGS